ncbi:hypothetical protein RUM44_009166 [Polyplax serrata]|uniref:Uncharacterized protein n=1 Tax=Polyplax serrata TaxID=468196 RepID=A0ABR1ARZ0_POLSC
MLLVSDMSSLIGFAIWRRKHSGEPKKSKTKSKVGEDRGNEPVTPGGFEGIGRKDRDENFQPPSSRIGMKMIVPKWCSPSCRHHRSHHHHHPLPPNPFISLSAVDTLSEATCTPGRIFQRVDSGTTVELEISTDPRGLYQRMSPVAADVFCDV